jgi:uncharacterized protein (AIM24 family)
VPRTPATSDEVGGQDEEFLFHLQRGSELLSKGELAPASAALARARELRPRDPQVLGLLGQSLYKQARYEEAVEAYARLVDENPVEAAARVNLGLASLKAKRHSDAVRQLEIALDLNPEHKKAMGYLGLAWLEQGDFERARSWFVRSGSEQMVTKCDELLALAKAAPEPAAAAGTPEAAGAPALGPPGLERLSDFAAARRVSGAGGAAFAVTDRRAAVSVVGEVLVRAEGLLAVEGALRFALEMKRFRGRATEKPFGEGEQRMLRAAGEGGLLLCAGEARFSALRLEDESSYFREEVVSGFEATVQFENGRIAARPGPDLNLVHLRGPGALLLRTRGAVVALDVQPSRAVRIPVAALVGFSGAVTPRVVALLDPAGPEPVRPEALAVELSGSGRVLVDEGAAA